MRRYCLIESFSSCNGSASVSRPVNPTLFIRTRTRWIVFKKCAVEFHDQMFHEQWRVFVKNNCLGHTPSSRWKRFETKKRHTWSWLCLTYREKKTKKKNRELLNNNVILRSFLTNYFSKKLQTIKIIHKSVTRELYIRQIFE